MATKILKIPSNQSGPFTSSNNKVDITIPDYMSYIDAMKTCVLINMKFVDGTGNPAGELFDGALNDGLDIRCLLKTVTISSSKNGVLEQIPALNVLKMNLDQTQRDFEDDNALVYMGFQSGADYHTHNVTKDKNNATTNRLGTFIQKNNSGSTLSKAETYLKIPLSSIFGICSMRQFPVNLFGDVRISLEFEDDAKIIQHLFKYTQHRDIASLQEKVTRLEQAAASKGGGQHQGTFRNQCFACGKKCGNSAKFCKAPQAEKDAYAAAGAAKKKQVNAVAIVPTPPSPSPISTHGIGDGGRRGRAVRTDLHRRGRDLRGAEVVVGVTIERPKVVARFWKCNQRHWPWCADIGQHKRAYHDSGIQRHCGP